MDSVRAQKQASDGLMTLVMQGVCLLRTTLRLIFVFNSKAGLII